MKANLVSIIVLTYNSENHIKKCIKSISNQDYSNYELIIVDNNSKDDTRKMLAKFQIDQSTNVKIILNSHNLGYNLGNLVGIENAQGGLIAIVNPDSILDKSWLSNIISTMEKNSKLISVSGTLLNADGTLQSTGGLIDLYGAVEQRKSSKNNSFFYNPGSAFIFKKSILSKLRFDPNLFMYYEDVDFAWQTRLQGHEIGYCKDANSVHLGGQSQLGLPPIKFYHITKNRIYICLKNYSTNRILRRINKILFLILMDSIYYSYNFKSPSYFVMMTKAVLWNLINLKKIKNERKKIQQSRIISDIEIEKFMIKNSIELKILSR